MKFFSVLISTLLGVSAVNALECKVNYRRPSIYEMSSQEIEKYFNGIKKLNSGPRPTEWDKLARKHVELYAEVHSTDIFLAFHRFYLIELETKLRQVDDSLRIPYWDWSVHYDNMHEDPVWDIFGKNGDSSDKCVRNGPFSNFTVFYGGDVNDQGSERCIHRRDNYDVSFGGTKSTLNSLIDAQDNGYFREYFELGPHGLIHNGIGEDFQGHASPNDPLFWSHHAFIDKIWFDRQNRHTEHTLTYPISGQTPVPGYDYLVYESYDPFEYCYSYLEDNYFWDTTVKMQSAKPIEYVEPFVPLQTSYLTRSGAPTTEEIQKNAYEYIMNGVTAPDMNGPAEFGASGCRVHAIPKIMDIEYIRHMNYNESKVRGFERLTALRISEENEQCLA